MQTNEMTVIKRLKNPLKIAGTEATEIEMRPPTMADVCDAEKDASPLQPNSFNMHMAALTMVRAGTFSGPFVVGHFKGMRPSDFKVIVEAMQEAERLGED